MWWESPIFIAALGLLAGVLGAWLQSRRTPAQNHADESGAASELAEAANALIAPYRAEVETLRGKVATLETKQEINIARIGELEAYKAQAEAQRRAMQGQIDNLLTERQEWKLGIYRLINQLTEMEIKPAWKPKDTGPLPL